MEPVVEVERRRTASEAEVADALRALAREPQRIPARDWPAGAAGTDLGGLYAWWTDADGAKALSDGIGVEVAPGRIYAGLTGATKWPSGKAVRTSLRGRIGGNHLRGTIRGSTFRRTLAAALRRPLGLELAAPGQLTPAGERVLTGWMRAHLEVAIHPFAAADALADCEQRVLRELDPPLNLEGMPPTPLRAALTELRRGLSRP
jgi:hypothetical protein